MAKNLTCTLTISLILSISAHAETKRSADEIQISTKTTTVEQIDTRASLENHSIAHRTKNKTFFYKKHSAPTVTERRVHKASKPKNRVTPYVIGGEPTPEGERGYQVSLFSFGEHLCGGSLIDREWVLTAAHCVTAEDLSEGMQVMLGSRQLNSQSALFIPAVQVIAHEDYDTDFNSNNDIALVRLASPAPDYIPTVKLADENIMQNFVTTGAITTVSGWGYTDNNYDLPPLELQQVDLPIYDQETCNQAHYEEQGVTVLDSMICAGYPEGGKDSCFGDSGGPLTVTTDEGDFNVGIVSWGSQQCATPGLPGVYTRIASYLEWIESKLLTPPPPPRQALSASTQNAINDTFTAAKLYSLLVPETAGDLYIDVVASADVELKVYNAYYPLPSRLSCEATDNGGQQQCHYPLAGEGYYLIEVVSPSEEEVTVDLNTAYTPFELQNDVVIDGFRLLTGQTIITHFDVTEEGLSFDVQLSGEGGDADLYVTPLFDTDWVCFSETYESNEQCSLEDAPVGTYSVHLVGYEGVDNLTFSFNITEPVPEPPLPQAICQHSVVTQLGKYFIAHIDIFNVSDEYLVDWQITWEYQSQVDVKLVKNAIITSRSPYTAESSEPGRAIAPGSSTKIYMVAESAERIAENPTITGNYCY